MLDLDALLGEVTPDSPVGENLEYDQDYMLLERLVAPGQRAGGDEAPAEPDWRQIRDVSLKLLGRSKDIRVVVWLLHAQVKMEGAAGLSEGLQLLAGLLDKYWPTVYPALIEEENNDPIERMNALENLSDRERFVPLLRGMLVAESREVGRFTLRDLDMAQGRLPPAEGEQSPTVDIIRAAWLSGDATQNAERRAGVAASLEALKKIRALFTEKTGQAPELGVLLQGLQKVTEFYDSVQPQSDEAAAVEAEGGVEAQPGEVGETVVVKKSGGMSRDEALRMLRQVAEYVRKTEPSSPAPIFIDRAIRIMEMDFFGIVQELIPDARERIELLGGVKFEG